MCSREGKVKSVAPAHTAHLDVDLGRWTGTEVWGIFKQLKRSYGVTRWEREREREVLGWSLPPDSLPHSLGVCSRSA